VEKKWSLPVADLTAADPDDEIFTSLSATYVQVVVQLCPMYGGCREGPTGWVTKRRWGMDNSSRMVLIVTRFSMYAACL
jgi:hypothetical protein